MLPTRTEICLPLLAELDLRGGEAHPTDKNVNGNTVYDALAKYFLLTASDLKLKVGENTTSRSKWQNKVRWARNSLKDEGYLLANSRGLWTVSASGRDFLNRRRALLRVPYTVKPQRA